MEAKGRVHPNIRKYPVLSSRGQEIEDLSMEGQGQTEKTMHFFFFGRKGRGEERKSYLILGIHVLSTLLHNIQELIEKAVKEAAWQRISVLEH